MNTVTNNFYENFEISTIYSSRSYKKHNFHFNQNLCNNLYVYIYIFTNNIKMVCNYIDMGENTTIIKECYF
jgi:hypothetical protein